MARFGTLQLVQGLRLRISMAEGAGLIPSQGSSACHKVWPKIKKKSFQWLIIILVGKEQGTGTPKYCYADESVNW